MKTYLAFQGVSSGDKGGLEGAVCSKKVDLHFMHDSRTWRQRTGVKTLSHTPTLLACFIIRASFETVKVLVTHGRTQKTHGENIITETLTAVPNTLTQQRRCYHATGHLQQTDNRPI